MAYIGGTTALLEYSRCLEIQGVEEPNEDR